MARSQKQTGMTLLEVTFAMLLSGIVTVGLLGVLRQMNSSQRRVEETLVTASGNEIGSFQLTKAFLDADGFNYQGDSLCDPTTAATDFWRYNPSEPKCIDSVTGSTVKECRRTVTLQVEDGKRFSEPFIMVTSVRRLPTGMPSMVMANPPMFYDSEHVPINSINDFYTSGDLAFNEASLKTFLRAKGLMFNGATLRMMSPYPARRLASDGLTFDDTVAPSIPSITFGVTDVTEANGVRTGGNFVTERPFWLSCQKLADYNPAVDLDSNGLGYGKLDLAFRLVPAPRAGREAPLMIKAVSAVKLQLKRILLAGRNRDLDVVDEGNRNPRTGRTTDVLVMSDWSPVPCGADEKKCEAGERKSGTVAGAFRNPRIVADKVLKLVISRSDIRERSIAFNVSTMVVGRPAGGTIE